MDLTNGVKTVIPLKAIGNSQPLALTLNGANLRFIDLTSKDTSEIALWTIRTAEENISVTGDSSTMTLTMSTSGDENKLRLGEVIELFASGTFIGTVVVLDRQAGSVLVAYTNADSIDLSLVDTIVLRKDPFMLDGFTKPVESRYFEYFVCQADGDCELGIEQLVRGNFI